MLLKLHARYAGFSATLMAEVVYDPKILLPYLALGEPSASLLWHVTCVLVTISDSSPMTCTFESATVYLPRRVICSEHAAFIEALRL